MPGVGIFSFSLYIYSMYLEILCKQKKIILPPIMEGVLSTQKELSLWYFKYGGK